ncbi:MAG: aldehyde dehydrogenase family protein, partial [Rhodobacteraceae bacterium]|nr:aldehyde dehydrogenase family protein [Paracoccaceae bacterium]
MEMFIDGRYTPALSGKVMDVTDPTTGARFDSVPLGDAADADAAIRAAARAFPTWARVPMAERVRVQKACAQALRDHAPRIGAVLHRELGRPLPGCIGEIARSADLLDIYAEEGL